MKQYRDAVIHARVLNAPAGLAQSPGKRGKTNEVLLTLGALDGLCERLALLRRELIEASLQYRPDRHRRRREVCQ
jgi:hypothetical protein